MTRKLPKRPPLTCPDCGGPMPLKHSPWQQGRFVYLCEQAQCHGLMSAHPNGDPQGVPAPKQIRQARRHCHSAFDRLWMYPEDVYGTLSQRQYRKYQGFMRVRAYHCIADRLGIPEPEAHLSQMTDLDLLRRFWREATQLTPQAVREWWKTNRPTHKGDE